MPRSTVPRLVVDPDGVELTYNLADDITHVAFQRLPSGVWFAASDHRSERAAVRYWGAQRCQPGGDIVICTVQEVGA